MMPAFQDLRVRRWSTRRSDPIGRYSQPEEQAWPLVMLGSPRLSYVGGEVLWTDGGWNGAMTMGLTELSGRTPPPLRCPRTPKAQTKSVPPSTLTVAPVT